MELQTAHRKAVSDHEETNSVLLATRVFAQVLPALLVGSVLLCWLELRYEYRTAHEYGQSGAIRG